MSLCLYKMPHKSQGNTAREMSVVVSFGAQKKEKKPEVSLGQELVFGQHENVKQTRH